MALNMGVYQTVLPTLSSGPRSVTMATVEKEEVEIATRSVDVITTAPLTFGPSTFLSANNFYLGASNTNQKTYALSRAFINVTSDLVTLDFLALAPQKAFVNQSQSNGAKESGKTENPLYNADIAHLSLSGPYPVAVPATRNPNYVDSNTTGTNQNIVMVLSATKGDFVLTNTKKINDSNGNQTGGISGLASSTSHIFAAVNHTEEATFGGTNSGIAVVKSTGVDLTPIDATTGQEGNKSVTVKTVAGSDATNIDLLDGAVMFWDSILKRLFIGLQGKINSNDSTFISGVLVGRMDGDKLILEPVVPASVIGTDTATDKIVAFHKDTLITAPDEHVAIHNIKTMYTSTGKAYLIANGNIYNNLGSIIKTELFALPIITTSDDKSLIGTLAKKDSVTQEDAPTIPGELRTKTDAEAKTGQGTVPDTVENMFTLGDAVYACCAGSAENAKGIFKSTAIFDEDGLIRGWTPWQRVMGSTDPVLNAHIDIETGQFWYLTQTNNPGDTVKTTLWSQNDTELLGNLHKKLVLELPKEIGGIHQLFNFDEKTASFLEDEFSMMVATGYQKVALIRSGKVDGVFVPTSGTDFSTNLVDNVKIFNNNDLQNIGPICCAATSLSSDTDEGWLFVGGYGGAAVLRKGSDGTGWTQLDDLTNNISTPGFTFKEIGDFSRVHKLVCDNEYLYVLTPRALYRIAMDADKFKDTSPDALTATVIAQPVSSNDSLLDFLVSGNVGMLATTSGLYRTSNGQTIKSGSSWTEVKTKSDRTLGQVTNLSMQSLSKGSFDGGGNLYAVSANMTTDLATILRFTVNNPTGTVDDNTIQAITERSRDHYYAFGELRTTFVPDGTFGYHTLPKHFDRTGYGRKVNITSTQFSVRASDRRLPLGLDSSAHNAGIPVQNTASGAWVIPGDWGIRVNE